MEFRQEFSNRDPQPTAMILKRSANAESTRTKSRDRSPMAAKTGKTLIGAFLRAHNKEKASLKTHLPPQKKVQVVGGGAPSSSVTSIPSVKRVECARVIYSLGHFCPYRVLELRLGQAGFCSTVKPISRILGYIRCHDFALLAAVGGRHRVGGGRPSVGWWQRV